jgi:hypothetical protein
MTSIPAKVLNVHRLFNEYLLTVQVGRDNFAGKFDRLQFEAEPSDTSGGVACFPQLWSNGGDIFRRYHDLLLDRHAAESIRLGKKRSLRSLAFRGDLPDRRTPLGEAIKNLSN